VTELFTNNFLILQFHSILMARDTVKFADRPVSRPTRHSDYCYAAVVGSNSL